MGGSAASKQKPPQQDKYDNRRPRSSPPTSKRNYYKDDTCGPNCSCCCCCGGGGNNRRSSRKLLQLLETQSTILGEMGENARTTSKSALSISRPNSRGQSPAANPSSVISTRSAAMAEQNEVISRTRELQEQLSTLRQKTESKLHKYENVIASTERGEDLLEQLSAHVSFLRDRSQQLANTVSATSAAINPTHRGRSPPHISSDSAPQVIHRQLQNLSAELERERERLRQIVSQYGSLWQSGEPNARSPERYRSPSPGGRSYDSWERSPSGAHDLLINGMKPDILPAGRSTTTTTTTVTKVYQPHYMPRKWGDRDVSDRGTDVPSPYYQQGYRPRPGTGVVIEDPIEFLLNKIIQWLDNTEAWLVRCPIISPGSDAFNLTPLMKIRDTAQLLAKEGEFYAEQRAFLASLPSRTTAQTKAIGNIEARLNRVRNALADACSLASQACEVSNANKTAVVMLSEQTEAMATKCREFDRQGAMGDAASASKWLEYLLDSIQNLSTRHRNGKGAVERDVAAFYARCKQLSDDRSNFGALVRTVPQPPVPSALKPVPPSLESLVKNITTRLLDAVAKNENSMGQMKNRLGTLLNSRLTAEQRVVEAWQRVCDIELRRQAAISSDPSDDRSVDQRIAILQQLKAELAQVVRNEKSATERAPPLLGSAFFRLASVVETAIAGDIDRLESSLPTDTTSSTASSIIGDDLQQQTWSTLLADIDQDLSSVEQEIGEFESKPVDQWLRPEGSNQSPFSSIISRLSQASNRIYDVANLIDRARPGDYSFILRQLNDVERRLTQLWRRFSQTVLARAIQLRSSSPSPSEEENEMAQNLVQSSSEAVRQFASFLVRVLEMSNPSTKSHLCVSSNCCRPNKEFDSQLSEAVNGLRNLASQLGSENEQTPAEYREQLNSAMQAIANVQASLDEQRDRRTAYATAWRHYVDAEQQLNERLRRLRSVVDRILSNPPSPPATALPPEQQFETLVIEANEIAKSAEVYGQQCRDYFKSGSPGSRTSQDRLFIEAEVLSARFGWITVDSRQLAARLAGGANSAKLDSSRRATEQRESENCASRLINVERIRATTLDLRPIYGASRRNLRIEIDWLLDKVRRTFDPELAVLRQARPSSLAMIDNAMGRISDLEASSVVAKFALSALKEVLQDLDNCATDLVPYADSDYEKFKKHATWRLQLAYREADWLLKQLADAKWHFVPSLRSAFEAYYDNVKLSCLRLAVKKQTDAEDEQPASLEMHENDHQQKQIVMKPAAGFCDDDDDDDLNMRRDEEQKEEEEEKKEKVDDNDDDDDKIPIEATPSSSYIHMVVMASNDQSSSDESARRRKPTSSNNEQVSSEKYTVYHSRLSWSRNPQNPANRPPPSESSSRIPVPSSQTRPTTYSRPAPAPASPYSGLSRSRSSNEQLVLEKAAEFPKSLVEDGSNNNANTNNSVVLPQSAVITCDSGLNENNNITTTSSDNSDIKSTCTNNLAAQQQLTEDKNSHQQGTAVLTKVEETLIVETITTKTENIPKPSDFVFVLPPPPPEFGDAEGKAGAGQRVLRIGGASSLLQPAQASAVSGNQVRRSLPVRLNKQHRLSSIPESPSQQIAAVPGLDSGGIPRNESAPSSLASSSLSAEEDAKADKERASRIDALDIAHRGTEIPVHIISKASSIRSKEQVIATTTTVFPIISAPAPLPPQIVEDGSRSEAAEVAPESSPSDTAEASPMSGDDETKFSPKRRRIEKATNTPSAAATCDEQLDASNFQEWLCRDLAAQTDAGETASIGVECISDQSPVSSNASLEFADALVNTDEYPWKQQNLLDSSSQTEPLRGETSKLLTVIISDDDSAMSVGTKRRDSSESSSYSLSSHPPTTPSPRSNTSSAEQSAVATSSPEALEVHRVHRLSRFRRQEQPVVIHPRDPIEQEYSAPIKFPASDDNEHRPAVQFEDKGSSPIKIPSSLESTSVAVGNENEGQVPVEAETQTSEPRTTTSTESQIGVPFGDRTETGISAVQESTTSSTGDDSALPTPLPGQSIASQAEFEGVTVACGSEKTEVNEMDSQTDYSSILINASMQAGPSQSEFHDANIGAVLTTISRSSETIQTSVDSKSTTTLGIPSIGIDAGTSAPVSPAMVSSESQGDVVSTENVSVGNESPIDQASVQSQTLSPAPVFDANFQAGTSWSDRREMGALTEEPLKVDTGDMDSQTEASTLTTNVSMQAGSSTCDFHDVSVGGAAFSTTDQSIETSLPAVDSKATTTLGIPSNGVDAGTSAPVSPVMISSECQSSVTVVTEHVCVGDESSIYQSSVLSQTMPQEIGCDASFQAGTPWLDRCETGASTEPIEAAVETGEMEAQTEPSKLLTVSSQAGSSCADLHDVSISATCSTADQSIETVPANVDTKSTTTLGIPAIGVDAGTSAPVSPAMVSSECQGSAVSTENVSVGDDLSVDLTSVQSQTISPLPGSDANVQTGTSWSERCETASNTNELPTSDDKTTCTIQVDWSSRATSTTPPPDVTSSSSQFEGVLVYDVSVGSDRGLVQLRDSSTSPARNSAIENVVTTISQSTLTVTVPTSEMGSSPLISPVTVVHASSGSDLQMPGEMRESSTSPRPSVVTVDQQQQSSVDTGEIETQTAVTSTDDANSQAGVPFSSCTNEAGISAVCSTANAHVDSEDLVITVEQETTTLTVDTTEFATSPLPSPTRFESFTQSAPLSLVDAEVSAVYSTSNVGVDIDDLIMTAERSTATLTINTTEHSTSPQPPAETFDSETQSSPPPSVSEAGVNAVCNVATVSSGSDTALTADNKATITTSVVMQTTGTSPSPRSPHSEVASQAGVDLVTVCVGSEVEPTSDIGTTTEPNKETVVDRLMAHGETQTSTPSSPARHSPRPSVETGETQTTPLPTLLDISTEAFLQQKVDLAPLYDFIEQQLQRLLVDQEQERTISIPKLMAPDSLSCRGSLVHVMSLLSTQKAALVDLTNRVELLSTQASAEEDEQAGAIFAKLDAELNQVESAWNAAKFLQEKAEPFDIKMAQITEELADLLNEKAATTVRAAELRHRLELINEKAGELGMFILNDSGCFAEAASPSSEQAPDDHHTIFSALAGGIQQHKVAKMREDLQRAEALVAERERQEIVRARVGEISDRLDLLLREAASVVDSSSQITDESALTRCDEILRTGLRLADDMASLTGETTLSSHDTSQWGSATPSSVSSMFGEHLRNQQQQVDAVRRQLSDYQQSARDEIATQQAVDKCRGAIEDSQQRLASLRSQIDDIASEFTQPALSIDDDLFDQAKSRIEEDIAPEIAKLEDALANHGAELSALASKRPPSNKPPPWRKQGKRGRRSPQTPADPIDELSQALADCRRNSGVCTRRLGELAGLQSSVAKERAAYDAAVDECRRRIANAQRQYDEMVAVSLSEGDHAKLANHFVEWCRLEADLAGCRQCVMRNIGEVKKEGHRHHQLSQLLADIDLLAWYVTQTMETIQIKMIQQQTQSHVQVVAPSVVAEDEATTSGGLVVEDKPQGETSDAENKQQEQTKRGKGKAANRAKKALRQKEAFANKKGRKAGAKQQPQEATSPQESEDSMPQSTEDSNSSQQEASIDIADTSAEAPSDETVLVTSSLKSQEEFVAETTDIPVAQEASEEKPSTSVEMSPTLTEPSDDANNEMAPRPRQRKGASGRTSSFEQELPPPAPRKDDKGDDDDYKRGGGSGACCSGSGTTRHLSLAHHDPGAHDTAMSPALRRVLVAVPIAILASTIAVLALMHWLLPQLCPGDTPCELQNNLRRSLTLMLTYQKGPPPT